MAKLIDELIRSLRSAAVFNPEIQVAPACILWPDSDRQWQAVIPRLQLELPQLLILGDYAPEQRTGPAIWLRCALAGLADGVPLPEAGPPLLYLPGVGRQDLRAISSCPDDLKPLAELQYRGVIWSQINAKDWTILAWLKSDQGGLGLDVAQDRETKGAMQLALTHLLGEELDLLKGKRLDRDYFNTLLMGGDPVRDLLLWLDNDEAFRAMRGETEWRAFVEVCRSQLAFDPERDGILAGATCLAEQNGPWLAVWERFCEAPGNYAGIPVRLRQCKPTYDLLADAGSAAGWPQWNQREEEELRAELGGQDQLPPHEARLRLLELERRHGERRELVWAALGEAPLAKALAHLAVLANVTRVSLSAGDAMDLATGYRTNGWRGDDALLGALAKVTAKEDFQAVAAAIRAVYKDWAEKAARHLQKLVDEKGYPGGNHASASQPAYANGDCLLFVDGLRLDCGRRLSDMLEQADLVVNETTEWAALPSVTATGKAAVSPVREMIVGEDASNDFEPVTLQGRRSLKGGYQLKKLLDEAGWQVLNPTDIGDPQGRAWCEFGDIDHEGHARGWKLARHLDGLLSEVVERIQELLQGGWKRVTVVTDHGWLLLPRDLPKIDLPAALADSKWGRCAVIKAGASCDERLYSWYWNPSRHFALADGISCFRKGMEYSHGGLSLQECLVPRLEVTQRAQASPEQQVEITDMVWKGLRCTVAVEGDWSGLQLDVRRYAGDSESSLALTSKGFKGNGTASVVIEDEELEGVEAFAVILDNAGKVVEQAQTFIGGKG